MLNRVFRIAELRDCPWFGHCFLQEPRPEGDGRGLQALDRGGQHARFGEGGGVAQLAQQAGAYAVQAELAAQVVADGFAAARFAQQGFDLIGMTVWPL